MGAYSPDPGSICVYCGSLAVVLDHVVPRARGGWGGSNLVPACRACNISKRDLDVAMWLGGQVVVGPDARRERIWVRLADGEIASAIGDHGLGRRVGRDVFRRIVGMPDRLAMSQLVRERVGDAWSGFDSAIEVVESLVGSEDEVYA